MTKIRIGLMFPVERNWPPPRPGFEETDYGAFQAIRQ